MSSGCVESGDVVTLGKAGVATIVVPGEALEEHEGPPLTLDDLIDFHLLLQAGGWERQPTATCRLGRGWRALRRGADA